MNQKLLPCNHDVFCGILFLVKYASRDYMYIVFILMMNNTIHFEMHSFKIYSLEINVLKTIIDG